MPETYRILVIDDDQEMRQSLRLLLDRAGWDVKAFGSAKMAMAQMDAIAPDVVLSDVRMPGMSGLDVLETMSGRDGPPLVLISAHGDIAMAVNALQAGAYSFIEKPYEPRRLMTVLQHAAEQYRLQNKAHRMRDQLVALTGLDQVLLGADRRLTALKSEIVDLATMDGPVLILGQTGTGKELIARAIHRLGARKDADFVALNCATLAPERVEEQIFGTADDRLGSFRKADGGTLFLDEVGACPVEVQAKLLRVLETGSVQPVGSDTDIRTNVRLIAATNEDLEGLVAQGRFRRDFLFRLNNFQISVPKLADRGDDVVLLFSHFLKELSEIYEVAPPPLTPDDVAALLAHPWPGNVRELRHVAERRVLAARRGRGSVSDALRTDDLHVEVPSTLREAVASFERTLIAQAIKSHGGRMDAVAEALGIGRRTLNEKIVKLGLEKSDILD